MSWYRVEVTCRCGEKGQLGLAWQIRDGPTEAGTVAELYPDGDLPQVLREMLHDLLWCKEAQEYLEIGDPGRVRLTPIEGRW